ncbi:MAG: hypothetical protein AAF556_06035 [Pseudomonadota bacterium]
MGSSWDGRLARAARAALETGTEWTGQAVRYGQEMVRPDREIGGYPSINPDLLTDRVSRRTERRIIDAVATPGPIDRVALRTLGLTTDAVYGLEDARKRGDLTGIAGDQTAADWWRQNEPGVIQAADLNRQAREMIWGMASQTLGGALLGLAAMAGGRVPLHAGNADQDLEAPREPRATLPAFRALG